MKRNRVLYRDEFPMEADLAEIAEEFAKLFISWGLQERYTEEGTSIAYDRDGRVVYHLELKKPKDRGLVPQLGHMAGVARVDRWVR